MESEPLLTGSINYGSHPDDNDHLEKGSPKTRRLSYSVAAEYCCVGGGKRFSCSQYLKHSFITCYNTVITISCHD